MLTGKNRRETLLRMKAPQVGDSGGGGAGFRTAATPGRGPKIVSACFLLWLLFNVFGFFLLKTQAERKVAAYHRRCEALAADIGETTGAALLEMNRVSLAAAIEEAQKGVHISFAAIVDHSDLVVAHSDPAKVNRPFRGPAGLSAREAMQAVRLAGQAVKVAGQAPQGGGYPLLFSRKIRYAGVTIGRIVVGPDPAEPSRLVSASRVRALLLFSGSTLLMAAFLVVIARWSPEKGS